MTWRARDWHSESELDNIRISCDGLTSLCCLWWKLKSSFLFSFCFGHSWARQGRASAQAPIDNCSHFKQTSSSSSSSLSRSSPITHHHSQDCHHHWYHGHHHHRSQHSHHKSFKRQHRCHQLSISCVGTTLWKRDLTALYIEHQYFSQEYVATSLDI